MYKKNKERYGFIFLCPYESEKYEVLNKQVLECIVQERYSSMVCSRSGPTLTILIGVSSSF